jgi:hypothetical protein
MKRLVAVLVLSLAGGIPLSAGPADDSKPGLIGEYFDIGAAVEDFPSVDGKKVVENGGLHGMEEKNGTIELKAGDHDLKVELFENEGEVGLKVSWRAEGLDKQIIPASALFHKSDEKLDK